MSIKLVVNSLERFLKENIPSDELFITTDSSKADVFSFNALNTFPLNTNPSETTLTGTVDSVSGINLIGNSTLFLTELLEGDLIKINDEVKEVVFVNSETDLETDTGFTTVVGGETITIPSGTEIVLTDTEGSPLNVSEDLVGWIVTSESGEVRNVVAYDNLTSTISINSPFTSDLMANSRLTISRITWAFIKVPYVIDGKGCNSNREQLLRVYIYIKTKSDSAKSLIYDLIDKFNDVIKENYNKFTIYDSDEITRLADAKFESTVRSSEVIEEDESLQSYLFNFQVSYYKKYI